MLRKILSFSRARLKSAASFSSAHFKVVILTAFLVVFGTTFAIAQLYPINPECCASSLYTYAGTCQNYPHIDCEPDTCIHCQCDAAISFTIPTQAQDNFPPYTWHTCNHPGTNYTQDKSRANAVITTYETNGACITTSELSEHVVYEGWNVETGSNRNDMSFCPIYGKGNCASEGNSDCTDACGLPNN